MCSYENNMLKIYIKSPFTLEISGRKVCEKFVYKYSGTIEYVKN